MQPLAARPEQPRLVAANLGSQRSVSLGIQDPGYWQSTTPDPERSS
jgi:hypothetical protein